MMATVDAKVVFTVRFTSPELNLVTKALSGALEAKDEPAARELEAELARQRLAQMKDLAGQASRLEEHLKRREIV